MNRKRQHIPLEGAVLAVLFVAVVGTASGRYFLFADFGQDYAAAWAVLHGLDPAGPIGEILDTCCPNTEKSWKSWDIAPYPTAHPPPVTLLVLPFALFPWAVARWLWLLVSFGAVIVSWAGLRLGPGTILVFLPLWVHTFAMGALEPVLLLLLAGAVRWQDRQLVAGGLLGVAIAVKVYPVVLLLGLVVAGRYRAVLAAVVTMGLLGGIAEGVVGGTLRWVAYIHADVLHFVDSFLNASLVHVLRAVFPHASPTYLSIGLVVGLTIPLVSRLRTDPLRPLVAVVLLSGAFLWIQYVTLLVLAPLRRLEQGCLGAAAVVMIAGYFGWLPRRMAMSALTVCFLAALGLVWWGSVREGWASQADKMAQ